MPTRKIAEIPEQKVCRHPEHNPPNMMVWEPGVYEHECPRCGEIQTFTVGPKPTLRANLTQAPVDMSDKEFFKPLVVEPDMSADYAFGYDWASLRR
jgi:hypothetical protein